MILVASFRDEEVAGQRKAAGRMIRQRIVLAVDKYNVLVAFSTGTNPLTGKQFYANLTQLSRHLEEEFGLDIEECLEATQKAFERLGGESMSGKSWTEIDKAFNVGQRTKDSTGNLELWHRLKEAGWADDSEAEEVEEEALVT